MKLSDGMGIANAVKGDFGAVPFDPHEMGRTWFT